MWYKYGPMSTQTIPRKDLVFETENLRAEIASLKQQLDSMRKKCLTLEEQIEWFKRQIFGKRSEKILDPTVEAPDLPGFVYPEDEEPVETKPVSAHERRAKSKKVKIPLLFQKEYLLKHWSWIFLKKKKYAKKPGSLSLKLERKCPVKLLTSQVATT